MIGTTCRVGIDLGGTKTSVIALDGGRRVLLHKRVATPRDDYDGTVRMVRNLVDEAGAACKSEISVGVGIPGSLSPLRGTIQNANSTWLNGRALKADLEAALGRPVRLANDANCFAMSEATDGAAAGASSVFGIILGTGCGGGLVINGRLVDGPRGIGGEWGHNPLPAPERGELPGPQCWCGRHGCIEAWVSGPGMANDHNRRHSSVLSAEEIAQRAGEGCGACNETLSRHASRLARAVAGVVNIFDPDCIVLGGGLSNLSHLYDVLPDLVAAHIFADEKTVEIARPVHGDDSGVRGAAFLWNED